MPIACGSNFSTSRFLIQKVSARKTTNFDGLGRRLWIPYDIGYIA